MSLLPGSTFLFKFESLVGLHTAFPLLSIQTFGFSSIVFDKLKVFALPCLIFDCGFLFSLSTETKVGTVENLHKQAGSRKGEDVEHS